MSVLLSKIIDGLSIMYYNYVNKEVIIVMNYEIFKHKIKIDDEAYDSFGIVLYQNGTEVVRVYDVSTDYDSVTRLVGSLNDGSARPDDLPQILRSYFETA